MTLIKLLLEKSPKLKRMVIWHKSDLFRRSTEKVNVILKEVNIFDPASPNAIVIYEMNLAQREYFQFCNVAF